MIEVTFLGRGGQGAFTSSRILAIAGSLYEGKSALCFPSFGPERRGAPVFAYTKLDDAEIRNRSQSTKSDYIIILDESLYSESTEALLKENGKIVINSKNKDRYPKDHIITFNAEEVAIKYLGINITNTAMLAVFVLLFNIVSKESLVKAIEYDLKPKIAVKNKNLIEAVEKIINEGAEKIE